MKDLAAYLARRLSGEVRVDEPMARHTTWRIGGPADLFIEPAGVEELAFVLRYLREQGVPTAVIGNGSNLLVADSGVCGAVVKLGTRMGRIEVEGTRIRAEAGARLARVAGAAMRVGLSGFEFTTGIPASVGGAIMMNAGAHDRSMADVVGRVTVLDTAGRLMTCTAQECGFGYRQTVLQREGLIVVEAALRGTPRNPAEIREEMGELLRRRRCVQPLEYPSAGSVFKNPPGDAAGRLIDRAGGKGLRVGDAEVSIRHANFIVNLGSAKARDVRELIARVRELVAARFGITLELEVKLLGEDP